MTPYRRPGSATQHWIGSEQLSVVARRSRGEVWDAEVDCIPPVRLNVGVYGIPLRLYLTKVEISTARKGATNVSGVGVSP